MIYKQVKPSLEKVQISISSICHPQSACAQIEDKAGHEIGVYFVNGVEEFYTWHVQPMRQLACGCCSRSQVTPVPLLPRGIPYSCILPTISALPSSLAKLILREFNSTQSYATISFVSVWGKKEHDGPFRILKGLCGLERNRIGLFQPLFKDTNNNREIYDFWWTNKKS